MNLGFIRDIAITTAGGSAAHLVTLSALPIISRLYGPEAYGKLAVLLSISTLLTAIASLAYPNAIVLPKEERQAGALLLLSLLLAALFCLLTYFFLAITAVDFFALFKLRGVDIFRYLLPAFIFTATVVIVTEQWLLRKRSFSLLAYSRFAVSSISAATKIGAGFAVAATSTVLILAQLAASIVSACFLYILFLRKDELFNQLKHCGNAARVYRDFPIYRAPQIFMAGATQQAPLLFIGVFGGATAAAEFGITASILGIPAALLGNSVFAAFYPRVAKMINEGRSTTRDLFMLTFMLFLAGLAPLCLVVYFSPLLLSLLLGDGWAGSARYAPWLALFLFFQFLNRPSVAAIPPLGLQRGLLIYEIMSTVTRLLALVIGFSYFNDAVFAVALYCMSGALWYAILIVWVIFESRSCAEHE